MELLSDDPEETLSNQLQFVDSLLWKERGCPSFVANRMFTKDSLNFFNPRCSGSATRIHGA